MKKQSGRAAPKKLRAIQTSRHLRVVQRKHTGHLTHRRTTSYPTLVMIVLCVGVFLGSWTRFVVADTGSYSVNASVPGPAPSQPATIDNPTDGAKFTNVPITVSGSCPVNTYETLYRNGTFSGTALCDAAGHYTLQTSLFEGANLLQVRDFSPTDVAGPLSAGVTVLYQPPVPPTTTPGGGPGSSSGNNTGASTTGSAQATANSTSSVQAEPLIFKTSFNYEGHYTGEPGSWQLAIEGGTAPYAIAVDWGDGTRGLISRPRSGSFTIDHTYKKSGGYKGSYAVKFSATDAAGTQTFLQLLSIVNDPPAVAGSNQAGHNPSPGADSTSGYLRQLLKYVWPGYGVVVLMLGSFWLGERRELNYLKPRLKKVRHA